MGHCGPRAPVSESPPLAFVHAPYGSYRAKSRPMITAANPWLMAGHILLIYTYLSRYMSQSWIVNAFCFLGMQLVTSTTFWDSSGAWGR